MKRIISILAVLLTVMTFCCAPASAEGEPVYAEYVPRTQRGTLFYVDVYCGTELSAAVFELRYDPAVAEYRTVYCDDDNASAVGSAENGAVKIGCSSRSSAKGKLFRVAFKALRDDRLRLVLHTVQAVNGGLDYLTDIPDYTLDIPLDADGSAASSGVESSKSGASRLSKKTYGGSKSGIFGEDGAHSTESDDNGVGAGSGISRDYSGSDNNLYFLLGGAAAILACLLIIGGVMLYRRVKMRRSAPPEMPEFLTGADDEDVALYEEFEKAQPEEARPSLPEPEPEPEKYTLPEIFKDIE